MIRIRYHKGQKLARRMGGALVFGVLSVGVSSAQTPCGRLDVQLSLLVGVDCVSNFKPDDRGTEQRPLVVKAIPPPSSQLELADDAEDRREKFSSDQWLVGLTGALVFASFIQAVVFAVQALRLKETIIKMDQIATAQSMSVQRQLRAYINILTISRGEGGAQDDVTVEVKNFGQTPAYVARINVSIFAAQFPYDPKSTRPLERDTIPVPIPPLAIVSFRPTIPSPLTGGKALVAGMAVYVVGAITYRDAFDQPRTTNVRYHATQAEWSMGIFTTDREGNDCD